MIVDSYDVKSQSAHSYMKVQSTTMTIGTAKQAELENQKEAEGKSKDVLDLTKEAQEQFAAQAKSQLAANKITAPTYARDPAELRKSLLEMMIYALTGKKFKFNELNPVKFQDQTNGLSAQNLGVLQAQSAQRSGGDVQTYSFETFSYESESVSYNAKGVVNTADGRSISVDVSMSMSRQAAQYLKSELTFERKAKDPLIINYAGTAASLTDKKFDFDLTIDGNNESISFAGEGSGFLALDKNSDGTINDGSELFGPSTGSGFDELRQYDGDGNGWIDEADDVYSKLLVWSKDAQGNDHLYSLKDLDIGAIFLGETDTQYTMDGGIMRSTSFFLGETGGAGTISHIDLFT